MRSRTPGRIHVSGSGGHDLTPPPATARRVQVRATSHPATDRWITLTTRHDPATGSPSWVVGVVDGFNHSTQPPATYPTLTRARNAANRLFNAITEETT